MKLAIHEQWPVIEHLIASGDQYFLLNKLIEVTGAGQFEVRNIPEP